MTPRFTGKVMVVTGAAQGIGRRVAERAAAEGAKVLVVDRSEHRDTVVTAIRDAGGEAQALNVDLETWEGCDAAMAAAIDIWGRIDILINNVGGTIWAKPYEHYAPHEIDAEVRRSLFPTLYCCRAAIERMLPQGSGVIVNVSSIATRGLNRVPYAAAKGGVNAITASLAWEVGERGIRVVATAPGGTEAPPRAVPRNPNAAEEQREDWYQTIVDQTIQSSLMKRYGTLDEQAGPILFLASDEASYITGVTVPVGGGDLG
ncbi:1,6-dihydroxycyclohexa-2,4-diene-1-carboxylate dehydrogenase [Roseovarius sp. EC-HK134]|uniref:benzoate diol dehydrogenase BenD n=1 Tax=unclassified Roseovarius TaxID=2614913 RepID=UPI00125320EB|nr:MULTISPECIES: benzoate diol dehydrogenase BenD [unclassified Roseovarius]VVT24681.1 1,6-dihydroxycyclohexa-2,4-diene-1-carboxylate dehydrogenase [Roseovarius sp. EC-SD190]VVT24927.1 1,6-dihydroxycyclohexa-2,4-diene-1-carboxylate dehydrogenase [Roseovarius sp. EC-HK134]